VSSKLIIRLRTLFCAAVDGRYAYSDEDCCDLEDTRPLIRPGPLSYVDSWAISKVILRTDSGVYGKAGDGAMASSS
jgi:hypothetical protein